MDVTCICAQLHLAWLDLGGSAVGVIGILIVVVCIVDVGDGWHRFLWASHGIGCLW